MPDTYEPLGEQGIRAFALVIAKDGTIPSVLWEQMTGAEKYAVFMVAGLIMKAGAPAVGMPGSLANVRALDIAESFVPPPGHADPVRPPVPLVLDEDEMDRLADFVVACAEACVPQAASDEAQGEVMRMAGEVMADWQGPDAGRKPR